MEFIAWYGLIMFILSLLLNILSIGQKREPATPVVVIINLIISLPIIIFFILYLFV